MAMPRAIEEAWPMEPTVRKSLSCPSSRSTLQQAGHKLGKMGFIWECYTTFIYYRQLT